MKLVRLGALFGSVVLLVATSVSMVNKRSELRGEQDARVTSALLVADQAAGEKVGRAIVAADVAGSESSPDDLAMGVGDGAVACITTMASTSCTGPNLMAVGSFGAAVQASAGMDGAAVAVIDRPSSSVLIVARDVITVAIQIPVEALIGQEAAVAIDNYGATVVVDLGEISPDEDAPIAVSSVDGDRVAISAILLPGGNASVRGIANVENDVGLVGENLLLYGALLALGTVLVGLAGWTFLMDRRSLERRATTDELTGLLNRHEFERQTDEALQVADRSAAGVCLMLIDLNGFKQINDTLGHQFGDLVLQAAAERLQEAVRETDVVGRWGGDEFVILLPGVQDGTAVRNSAERIATRLSSTPIVGDVSVSAAIGAALFPLHGTVLDDLVRAADVAMYGAKTTGVTHRLADSMTTELTTEAQVSASGYRGPDRRDSDD